MNLGTISNIWFLAFRLWGWLTLGNKLVLNSEICFGAFYYEPLAMPGNQHSRRQSPLQSGMN